MGLGIRIDPNPCAKLAYEEVLICDDSNGPNPLASSAVLILRYPRASKCLDNLVNFSLEVAKSAQHEDFTTSDHFGSRDGVGLMDIVTGAAMDPRCNPHHGNAIQYLDDQNVLDLLASGEAATVTSFATSVFFLSDSTSTKISESVLKFGVVHRIALFAVSDVASFVIGKETYPILRKGEIVAMLRTVDFTSFKVASGSLIGVCFGIPGTIRARSTVGTIKQPSKSINARVVLRSTFYNEVPTTVNRPATTEGLFQSQIACPDCRRSLNILEDCFEKIPKPAPDEDVHLVVVVWNPEMANKLKDVDVSRYPKTNRWLLYTDESLLEGKEYLKARWANTVQVRRMGRYNTKRGNLDSCVPSGFVSPTLFSRDSDAFMYTLIQGLSLVELEGKMLSLLDINTGEHISIRSRSNLYTQLVYEIRDWNHPCHRPRRSAIGILKEWSRSYSLRDLA